MFDWIEEFIEIFGCDWETAAREYHIHMTILLWAHPESYDADDYDAE